MAPPETKRGPSEVSLAQFAAALIPAAGGLGLNKGMQFGSSSEDFESVVASSSSRI
jgi:hypothetical protein